MAQYYQIVGQTGRTTLTLEDLQRYCPNICLVNQDDQQYSQQQVVVQQSSADQPNDIIVSEGVQPQLVVGDGGLQYQQQYIIRHEPPPPPPPTDFQQQQQQQQQQHQQLHRQVYYTSDLPVDAQVVLQQAQQIIDASMMQQSSPQHPQHLVSPAHVLSQPTVIHPAQPPPPQPPPPPPPQHAPPPPPPQQMPRAATQQSQLMQHLQQHQHNIHMQQLQQQQLQQHLQQQQQHQQHMPQQQIQHQQVVMHAAYINQAGTPTRQAPPKLLNQALSSPGSVTLVRTPVRTVRPRRPVRPPMPGPQMQARLLNPQHQQVGTLASPGSARMAPQASPGSVRMGTHLQASPGSVRMGTHLQPSPGSVRMVRTPVPGVQARLLNPQHMQGVGSVTLGGAGAGAGTLRVSTPRARAAATPHAPAEPRLLNAHAQHRPQRPRTPINQQQQHPQHQLPPHVNQLVNQQQQAMNQQQVHQQQQQQQQQFNQLKLTQQQQLLLNQQNQAQQATRIITQQGTIVTQGNQSMMQHTAVQPNQNGPMPQQNTLTVIPQRSSPHPQQTQQSKKVIVQPNNANDMDDLEESITAAILTKHTVNEPNIPQQYSASPVRQASHQQMNYSPQLGYQMSQTYEQQPHTLNQVLMDADSSEDERQLLTLSTGQRMTLAEYKRIHQPAMRVPSAQPQLQQQPRDNGRQTLVRSKEQQRPVQRVPPMQSQQVPQHDNNEPPSGPSEQSSEPQSAKMLIFLQNGEQRLITFTLPKESCTLQEVLEQVNVPFSEDTHIQCMQNTSSEIDYFVSVGSTSRIEDLLENHPMLVGDISSRSSPNVSLQPQSSEMSTPEKSSCPDTASQSPESPAHTPPPRYVDGMLALCKTCGYTGFDFSRCERCKRVFSEEPKGVPIASKKVEQKKKDPEKLIFEKQNCGDGIKLNLLKTTVKNINSKTPVQDKKPPRVRKPRGKQPDPEPVILTLSSDEEDSNSSLLSNQHEHSIMMKEPSMSEIESGTPDSGIGMDQIDDVSRDEMSHSSMQDMVASLTCRTIRIGSYKYTPKEKVTISSKGVKIVAPSLKDESRDVALQIQLKEVVKLLAHFSKGVPVIFVYTVNKCGIYIRKALDMVDESGPYYNPMSKIDPQRRITLLPDCISDEAKMAFKVLFGKTMDELNGREANDILVRTCTKDSSVAKMATRSSSAASASGVKSTGPTDIRQILIYPPGKGGIPINTEDYMCLAQDQFLNDVIIDFYLKYLVHDVLTHSQREKTHIFSTFFYKRLTTKPSKVNKSSNPHEWDSSLTPAQKRHLRVKTWTKNVNIFEKDFIVVPINENCHWFVAIICYPTVDGCRSMIDNRTVTPQEIKKRERRSSMQNMQIGNTTITPLTKQEQLTLSCDSDNLSERDEAEAEESDLDMQCDSDEEEAEAAAAAERKVEPPPPPPQTEPIKQPCILIFDSLAGASRSRVVATLRDYLTCEYQAKISPTKVYNKDNIKGSCPKIPQQNNFTDCGLYLLQYVEQFFKDPVKDYALPIKQLANWFDEIVVTRKREEISLLLKALMNRYNPDSHLALPDIAFPTLNGKLVETEEHQDESDGDKPNSSTSKIIKTEIKDSEGGTTLTFVKQISGDIVLKQNFSDATDALLRKTIRISTDAENRLQLKPSFIKKGDNENQILIPIKLHTSSSELVKDIQNTLLVNKNNKSISDKKHGVNNQNVSSVHFRQTVSESDNNSFLKTRRINKLEDVNESSKKFKRNEC